MHYVDQFGMLPATHAQCTAAVNNGWQYMLSPARFNVVVRVVILVRGRLMRIDLTRLARCL